MRALHLLALAILTVYFPLATVAQPADAPLPPNDDNSQLAIDPDANPVGFFRRLLDADPDRQQKLLEDKSVWQRKRILQGIEEYRRLTPESREYRLQLLELRWYFLQAMAAPKETREELIVDIPDPFQSWVRSRLKRWELLPEKMRSEILEHDQTLRRLSQAASERTSPENSSPAFRPPPASAEWNSLPLESKRRIYTRFREFFELSERERHETLNMLAPPHKSKVERLFETMVQASEAKRKEYLDSLEKFVAAEPASRELFFNNIELWEKMSPEARKIWRQAISRAPKPPIPDHSSLPPMPPRAQPPAPASAFGSPE